MGKHQRDSFFKESLFALTVVLMEAQGVFIQSCHL